MHSLEALTNDGLARKVWYLSINNFTVDEWKFFLSFSNILRMPQRSFMLEISYKMWEVFVSKRM